MCENFVVFQIEEEPLYGVKDYKGSLSLASEELHTTNNNPYSIFEGGLLCAGN